MAKIHILYEADHRDRAATLAGANPGATLDGIDTPPHKVDELETLTFWGHGTMASLCGKSATDMARLIKSWKNVNSGLKTVELITCNARHFAGDEDSYANSLKSELRSGILSSTRNIKVWGLPVAVGGIRNAYSILLADWQSSTWVYITAPGPGDDKLMQVTNLIKYDNSTGRLIERPDGTDVATLANRLVIENHHRDWSMVYGTFGYLRKNLVQV